MRLMYSLGGGEKSRVYLDARVHYVTPGSLTLKQFPGLQIPLLILQYDLPELRPVSAILGAMRVRKENPEVYIWQEESSEPEVAILFRTREPDKVVLDDVAGKIGEILNETVTRLGCEHVFTLAEVNLNRGDVEKCIQYFEYSGHLVIEIGETGSSPNDPAVHRFVTRNLHRKEYRFEL